MEAFTESLSDMKVYDFELIEYTADNWKTIFCVEHRRALKHVMPLQISFIVGQHPDDY